MIRKLIPLLAAGIACASCARNESLSAGRNASEKPVEAAATARGEAQPLTGDPDLDSEAALTPGLEYESGRVVIDEERARAIVQVADPALAQAEFARAESLYAQNYFRDALGAYSKAILLDRKNPRLYQGLGKCFNARRASKEAVASFATALALDPESVDLRFALGDALARLGDREGAVRELRVAIEREPARLDAHQKLATELYYSNDYAGAWREVHAVEALGGSVAPQFRALLEGAMSEPNR
jgi:tetratricopeptide (TPR) repeat protein